MWERPKEHLGRKAKGKCGFALSPLSPEVPWQLTCICSEWGGGHSCRFPGVLGVGKRAGMEAGPQHPQEDGQRCRKTPGGAWVVQPPMPAKPSCPEKLTLDSEEFSGSWRGGASSALLSYRSPARECEEELSLESQSQSCPATVPLLIRGAHRVLAQRVGRAQAPAWQNAPAGWWGWFCLRRWSPGCCSCCTLWSPSGEWPGWRKSTVTGCWPCSTSCWSWRQCSPSSSSAAEATNGECPGKRGGRGSRALFIMVLAGGTKALVTAVCVFRAGIRAGVVLRWARQHVGCGYIFWASQLYLGSQRSAGEAGVWTYVLGWSSW